MLGSTPTSFASWRLLRWPKEYNETSSGSAESMYLVTASSAVIRSASMRSMRSASLPIRIGVGRAVTGRI